MDELLRMEHVSKRFGDFYANRDINLSVRKGEVHTLLGENGAGKSTTIRLMLGLARAEAGSVRLLGEVAGMVGSLLSTEGYIEPDDDAKKQLKDSAPAVLDAAIAALSDVAEDDWKTDFLHETLNKSLIEDGGYKPRLAFGPVRVAMSGRRVSPPLFESMEIVGKEITVARLQGLREHL